MTFIGEILPNSHFSKLLSLHKSEVIFNERLLASQSGNAKSRMPRSLSQGRTQMSSISENEVAQLLALKRMNQINDRVEVLEDVDIGTLTFAEIFEFLKMRRDFVELNNKSGKSTSFASSHN